MSLDSIQSIGEALEKLGYEVNIGEAAIRTHIGGTDRPFAAVLTVNDENELVITCQIAVFAQVQDVQKFMLVALDANTRTLPYAIGLLTATDNPELDREEEWPVVLTNSVPLGDLCSDELAAAMSSLLRALLTCGQEFKDVFAS